MQSDAAYAAAYDTSYDAAYDAACHAHTNLYYAYLSAYAYLYCQRSLNCLLQLSAYSAYTVASAAYTVSQRSF